MPGGDLCTKYPLRMLISALTRTASDEEICDITSNHIKNGLPYGEKELELILKTARDPNTIKTSSSGRFLDSISALTQLCLERTYEGEPAIKLESAARMGKADKIYLEPEIDFKNNNYVLKTSKTLLYLSNILNKSNLYDIMAFGQKYLASGLCDIACKVAEENDINVIASSGGVLANEYISIFIEQYLKNKGFLPIFSIEMPPGDGGISLGQSMIALSDVI
jgi:hydrogenase maturation protein HypF